MAKLTLKELAEQIKNKTKGQSSGGNQNWKLFYKFWSIPVDTIATVRFLPDANEDNPVSFFVENLTHELVINGKRETVACGKMHGDECPICKLSADYYDEKSPNHDRALGKKYYRKLSYIAQVMVIDSPIEHNQEQLVKLIDFGPQVFTQIQAGFASGDLEESHTLSRAATTSVSAKLKLVMAKIHMPLHLSLQSRLIFQMRLLSNYSYLI